jgi:hypothetical protein
MLKEVSCAGDSQRRERQAEPRLLLNSSIAIRSISNLRVFEALGIQRLAFDRVARLSGPNSEYVFQNILTGRSRTFVTFASFKHTRFLSDFVVGCCLVTADSFSVFLAAA